MSYLGFVTGVLARDKMFSFERVLWRATRGNLIFKQVCSGRGVSENWLIICSHSVKLLNPSRIRPLSHTWTRMYSSSSIKEEDPLRRSASCVRALVPICIHAQRMEWNARR